MSDSATSRELQALLDADPGVQPAPPPDLGEMGIDEADLNGSQLATSLPEGERGLQWRWADEIAAATPTDPDWILEGYLAPGTKTIVAGLPKAGKTTLISALVEAIAADAGSFLGRTVRGGTVLLASEEGDGTLAPKLHGLPTGRVRVLNRDACWPKPSWPELIAMATVEAQSVGASLLVLDSLAFWAALDGDRENDAGTAQAVFAVLDEACRAGLAVLIVHHQRKSIGANHGTGVRGSGAIAGAVDVLLEYERLGEEAPPSHRRIVALSRWPQTPDVLVIDYGRQDGTWRVVGEAEGRAGSDLLGIRERLLSAAPIEPPGATEDELATLVGLDKRKISGPLREMVGDHDLSRVGKGKKGDPYRYHRNAAPNAAPLEGGIDDSDAALPLKGGSIESDSAPDAAPDGQKVPPAGDGKGDRRGCTSHPDSPVESCRYCKAIEAVAG